MRALFGDCGSDVKYGCSKGVDTRNLIIICFLPVIVKQLVPKKDEGFESRNSALSNTSEEKVIGRGLYHRRAKKFGTIFSTNVFMRDKLKAFAG